MILWWFLSWKSHGLTYAEWIYHTDTIWEIPCFHGNPCSLRWLNANLTGKIFLGSSRLVHWDFSRDFKMEFDGVLGWPSINKKWYSPMKIGKSRWDLQGGRPAPCEVGELDKRWALVMRIEIYELQCRYKPTQSVGLHFVRKFINQTSDLWTDAATVVRAVREEKS